MQLNRHTGCFFKHHLSNAERQCLGLEMVWHASLRTADFPKAAEKHVYCQHGDTYLEPSPKLCTHSPTCLPPGWRVSPQEKTLLLSTPCHPACTSQWHTQWFLPGEGDRFWCLSLLCPLGSCKDVPTPWDPAHTLVSMILATGRQPQATNPAKQPTENRLSICRLLQQLETLSIQDTQEFLNPGLIGVSFYNVCKCYCF